VHRLQRRILARQSPLLLSLDGRLSCQLLSVVLRSSFLDLREYAFTVFEKLFKERGLPYNIRSDDGIGGGDGVLATGSLSLRKAPAELKEPP
jgi:hypothetical protein